MSGSAKLFADMLGLGPVMAAISDPAFHAQVQGFVAAVQDVQARVARIEAKLDALLSQEAYHERQPACLPAPYGSDGLGGGAATGGAVDDGAGTAPPAHRAARIAGARFNGGGAA